jgi:dTDP-D-glucose 4,6-dehydratase
LHPFFLGEVYNIGIDFEITNLELTKQLLSHFGVGMERARFVEDRAFNDFRYAVDSNKLLQLGWAPEVPFEVGLARTSEYLFYPASWLVQVPSVFFFFSWLLSD